MGLILKFVIAVELNKRLVHIKIPIRLCTCQPIFELPFINGTIVMPQLNMKDESLW